MRNLNKKNLLSKVSMLFLIGALILSSTGCRFLSDENNEKLADATGQILETIAGKDEINYADHGSLRNLENDEILVEILAALDTKDKEALKELFIPLAIEETENADIDAGLDYLMSIYDGTALEWHVLYSSSGGVKGRSEWYADVRNTYRITTDTNYYRLMLTRKDIRVDPNDKDRKENGLYSLILIPDDEGLITEKESYREFREFNAGIYYPQ